MISVQLENDVSIHLSEGGDVSIECPEEVVITPEEALRMMIKKVRFYESKIATAYEVLSKEL